MSGKIFAKAFNYFYLKIDKFFNFKKIITPDEVLFEKGYYFNKINKNKVRMIKIFIVYKGLKAPVKNLEITEEEFRKYADMFIKNKIEIYYDLTYKIVNKRRKYGFRKNKSIKSVL